MDIELYSNPKPQISFLKQESVKDEKIVKGFLLKKEGNFVK
jgi:hypothetical protein